MSIRIFLTRNEGLNLTQELDDEGDYVSLSELGIADPQCAIPENWGEEVRPIAELTPEEVQQVFDTIREVLEARL